jgi:hypothetical protein
MYVTCDEFCETLTKALVERFAEKQPYSNNGFDERDFSTYPCTPVNECLRVIIMHLPDSYEDMKAINWPIEKCEKELVGLVESQADEGYNEAGLLCTILKRFWAFLEPASAAPFEGLRKVVGDIAIRCGTIEFTKKMMKIDPFSGKLNQVFETSGVDEIYRVILDLMPEVAPPRLFGDSYLNLTIEGQAAFREDDRRDPWAPDFILEKDARFYVLTTFNKMDGCVAIFYPRLLKRSYSKLGEVFYILPRYTTHAVIYPISCISLTKAKSLQLNDDPFKERIEPHYLSRSVYKYVPSMDAMVIR